METQAEVAVRYEETIPPELREQFRHLNYGEMADRPECQEYAKELRDLERA